MLGNSFGSDANPMPTPHPIGCFLRHAYPSAVPNNQITVNCPSEAPTGGQNNARRVNPKAIFHRTFRRMNEEYSKPIISHAHAMDACAQGNIATGDTNRKAVGG